jgi:hypothetical protein
MEDGVKLKLKQDSDDIRMYRDLVASFFISALLMSASFDDKYT